MTFISFFLPNFSGKNFQFYINRSGNHGHPCLIPDLRVRFQTFPVENDVSCGLSIYYLYYVRYIPSIPNLLRIFITKIF